MPLNPLFRLPFPRSGVFPCRQHLESNFENVFEGIIIIFLLRIRSQKAYFDSSCSTISFRGHSIEELLVFTSRAATLAREQQCALEGSTGSRVKRSTRERLQQNAQLCGSAQHENCTNCVHIMLRPGKANFVISISFEPCWCCCLEKMQHFIN